MNLGDFTLDINFDEIFPKGISEEELKKIQEENKLISIDLSGFKVIGVFRVSSCNITGKLDLTNMPIGKAMRFFKKDGETITEETINLDTNKCP